MAACIYGICDGSGFVYDEDTNTATDCRCRSQIIAHNKARSLSAGIPRRYSDIASDRYPVTEVEPQQTVTWRSASIAIRRRPLCGGGAAPRAAMPTVRPCWERRIISAPVSNVMC